VNLAAGAGPSCSSRHRPPRALSVSFALRRFGNVASLYTRDSAWVCSSRCEPAPLARSNNTPRTAMRPSVHARVPRTLHRRARAPSPGETVWPSTRRLYGLDFVDSGMSALCVVGGGRRSPRFHRWHSSAGSSPRKNIRCRHASMRICVLTRPACRSGQSRPRIGSPGSICPDVRVHANSDKPAAVDALAYTQGNDIHLARGQETLVPHEGWHAVSAAAGTRKSRHCRDERVSINDDAALEHEADVMGVEPPVSRAERPAAQFLPGVTPTAITARRRLLCSGKRSGVKDRDCAGRAQCRSSRKARSGEEVQAGGGKSASI